MQEEKTTVNSTGQSDPSPGTDAEVWIDTQRSPDFRTLRQRLRKFVFPVSAIFLAWYLIYVLLADYAHDFMATPVFGEINVGILMGIGQFVSTVVITTLYVRFASRTIDPGVDEIRQNAEGTNP